MRGITCLCHCLLFRSCSICSLQRTHFIFMIKHVGFWEFCLLIFSCAWVSFGFQVWDGFLGVLPDKPKNDIILDRAASWKVCIFFKYCTTDNAKHKTCIRIMCERTLPFSKKAVHWQQRPSPSSIVGYNHMDLNSVVPGYCILFSPGYTLRLQRWTICFLNNQIVARL